MLGPMLIIGLPAISLALLFLLDLNCNLSTLGKRTPPSQVSLKETEKGIDLSAAEAYVIENNLEEEILSAMKSSRRTVEEIFKNVIENHKLLQAANIVANKKSDLIGRLEASMEAKGQEYELQKLKGEKNEKRKSKRDFSGDKDSL